MLNNIFLKTLYNRRWLLLGWGVGSFVLTVFVISLFHSLSGGQFNTALQNLPKSLEGLYGQADSYTHINGYINQQIFVRTLPIMGSIFAVILFTGALAGEEQDGTLQVLLTQPVGRGRIVFQKLLACMLLSAALCAIVFLACVTGAALVHESVHLPGLAAVCANLWLMIVGVGTFAYFLGAATGKRGLAGGLAGIVAFGSYLITSLSVGVSSLQKINKLSPFYYYGTASHNVVTEGLNGSHVLILFSLIVVFGVLAQITFQKRDIYQR